MLKYCKRFVGLYYCTFWKTRAFTTICFIYHSVKSVQIRIFFWSIFSRIRTEYKPEKIPYLDGVFSSAYFAVFGLNRRDTLYLSVFSPNTGKYEPEKTPYLDTLHAVYEQTTPNIRFTIEEQKIGSLPILDIKMENLVPMCKEKKILVLCVYKFYQIYSA